MDVVSINQALPNPVHLDSHASRDRDSELDSNCEVLVRVIVIASIVMDIVIIVDSPLSIFFCFSVTAV